MAAIADDSSQVRTGVVPEVRELYFQAAGAVRASLRRLTGPGPHVDDLLHDVFVVALRREAELQRASSPRAWLHGIATKTAANWRRRKWVRSVLGLEAAEQLSHGEAPDRGRERRDAERWVSRALAEMTQKKRETFVLFELDGLSGPEVAEALGIPVATVWTRLFHARKDFAAQVALLEAEEAAR